MNINDILLVILFMGMVTWALRAAPFFLMEFCKHHKVIQYLGNRLPGAVMVILVVYSVKGAGYTHAPYGTRSLLGIVTVLVLHLWKRNMFISIVGGVVVYGLLGHFLP